MALRYMSKRKNQWVSAKEMAQAFQCPFHPFSRALQKLTAHNLIMSRKGIGGGYIFTANLQRLSLYELMSVVLPPTEIAACLSGYCHLSERCNIQNPIHYLNKQFIQFYKTLTVQEILACGEKKKTRFKSSLSHLILKNSRIPRSINRNQKNSAKQALKGK